MLRKFNIKVNGKEYLVEMEEITEGGVASQAAPVAPQTPPATPQAPVTPQAPIPVAVAPTGSGETFPAPMPGTVLRIDAKVGDTVTANQGVLILEAMKLENEIVAPQAATITEIFVTAGQAVEAGQALFAYK